MSDAPLNQILPHWVDARKFAYQGVVLSGLVDVEKLKRLASAVSSVGDVVTAELAFSVDESRFRVLTGEVSTSVSVTCQRCLEAMPLDIEASLAVAIVVSEEEAKQLPKHLEPWLVTSEDGSADLYEVIEDELLLALPMVPYHDHQCIDPKLCSSKDGTPQHVQESVASRPNPFDILKTLKQSPDEKS